MILGDLLPISFYFRPYAGWTLSYVPELPLDMDIDDAPANRLPRSRWRGPLLRWQTDHAWGCARLCKTRHEDLHHKMFVGFGFGFNIGAIRTPKANPNPNPNPNPNRPCQRGHRLDGGHVGRTPTGCLAECTVGERWE